MQSAGPSESVAQSKPGPMGNAQIIPYEPEIA